VSKQADSLRAEAVESFEMAMASGARTWIDDALLPGEAEEFAEMHFVAGYMAGVGATYREFLHMVGLTDKEISDRLSSPPEEEL